MGDQVHLGGRMGGSSTCPCCSFLPESLFLPPSMISLDDKGGDGEVNSDSSLTVLSPSEALQRIDHASRSAGAENKRKVLLVDTHGHAHLERERNSDYDIENRTIQAPLVSLTCSVEEADWKQALAYASQSDSILPGLGVHPWYLADLPPNWLEDLETLLLDHPSAIVGEIGLCKMARFVRTYSEGKTAALLVQRKVFKDQMKLAAKLHRPVSVHCVKQHGVFMSVLKELYEEGGKNAFPPAIGMHSFTGTQHHVKEILKWEASTFPDALHPLFYFGFSHAINFAMCSSDKSRRQGLEAIRAVPINRLVVESDVHAADDVPAGTAGAVAYVASALEKSVEEVAERTACNGLDFLRTTRPQS